MKFKPLQANGIDSSLKRFNEAPDCYVKECPANSLGRCLRIGECLMEADDKK